MEETTAATSRNHQLDGLRGFAAIAVVIYHSILNFDSTQVARIQSTSIEKLVPPYELLIKIALAIFNGESAVVIFFLMSGAVLIQSLRRETADTSIVAIHFLVRRLLRVYPSLIVCVLLALALRQFFQFPGTFHDAMVNLTLTDFPLIAPSWTLQVELLAVPLLLAGWLVLQRWREPGLAVLTILTLAALKHTALGKVAPSFSWFAICFTFGMLIPTMWGERLARFTPRYAWPVLLLIVMFAKHFVLFGGISTTSTIQDVGAALLVNAVYHDRAVGLDRILSSKLARFYGRISYTLYLANVPFLDITSAMMGQYPVVANHSLAFGLLLGLVLILVATPIAYAITLLVEEPTIRLGRWLTQSRQTSAVSGRAT